MIVAKSVGSLKGRCHGNKFLLFSDTPVTELDAISKFQLAETPSK